MKAHYKLFYILAAAALVSSGSYAQATLVQWNFNGSDATTVPGGATNPTPSVGAGTASLIGGTTADFASGNTSAGTLETQVDSPPNFGWSTSTYAAAGTENKQRGVEFDVSTAGQAGIIFRMEQRLSNTSANTYVVQYTANRLAAPPVWVDAQTFTVTPAASGTGDTWYTPRIVDLSSVTALNNNPNVGIRVVAAFDPIAGDYLASKSTSTYAVTGKVRYDMVTVTSTTTLAAPKFNADENAFIMSPNPAGKELVNFNKPHTVQVFDITGKLVYRAANVSAIDARNFSSGIYIVRIETGAARKLVVQ
jgi:hypothetical protein